MRALRVLRIAGIIFGVLVLLVAGALIGGYFYVQSPSGREALAGLVSDLGSTPGVSEISIGEIGAGLPARLALADVEMRDRDGVWLSAERMLLTWKPWALFSRQLHVTALQASGIDVVRAPVVVDEPEEPESEETGFAMPSLPVSVRVDTLEIADLTLGKALAGERMTLQAEGTLAAPRDGVIRTDLAVRRTDAGGGITVDVAGAFDPSTEQLTVNVEAQEPAGGLVMRLAGLRPYPPFALSLKGDGPISGWQGKLAASGENLFAVNADIGIAKAEDLRVRLTGSADVDDLLQDPVRPLVGDAVSFDFAARYQDTRVFHLEALDIEMVALALTGGGRLDLDSEEIGAHISLEAIAPERLSALLGSAAIKSLDIEADVAGDVSDPDVTVQGRIGALTAPGLAAGAFTVDARVAPEVGESDGEDPGSRIVNVDVVATGVTSETPAAAALLGDTVTVTLQSVLNEAATAIDIQTVKVTAAAVQLAGQGRVGFAEGPTHFRLNGGIDDLAALGPALQMPLAGVLTVEASVDGDLDSSVDGDMDTSVDGDLDSSVDGDLAASRMTGSAAVRLTGFSMGQPVAEAVLGADAALTTRFALKDQGTAVVESFNLDARAFDVTGSARVTDGYSKLAAALQLVVDDLKPVGDAVATPLTGRLVTDVTAEGAVADPTVTVVANLTDATVQDIAVPTAKTTVTAANAVSGPQGLLTVVAETSMAALDAATRFAVEEGERLRLTDIAARALGVELSGNMNVPLAGGTFTGDLGAAFRGGDGGVTVAGTTARGRADLTVRLHDDGGRQAASVELDGSGLAVVPEGGEAIRIGRISAKGAGTDLLGTPSGKVSLSGGDIGAGAVTVGAVDADLSGSVSEAQFRVAARLTGEPSGTVQTRGTVAMADNITTVTIAGLDGAVAEVPFALQRPANIVIEGETLTARDVALKVSDGLITVNARQAPAEKSAQVRISDLPLAVVRAVAPGVDVGGDLNASADVVTEGSLLAGKLDLRVDGIVYGDPA
ncbi:MAG: hypothetical protein IPM60_05520 [Rhodospirillales bacterium]|nr:hypothetical protein [Rhodospirillales bacterium]